MAKTKFKRGIAMVSVLVIGSAILSQWFFTGNQEDVYSSMKEKYGITSVSTEVSVESEGEQTQVSEETVVQETKVETTPEVVKPMPGKTETRNVAGMVTNAYAERVIWDTLKANGYTDIQAAAALGNLIHESMGLQTDIVEKENGVGYGLMQWSNGRRTKLYNFCDKKGKAHSDLQCQVEYMISEMNSSEFYQPQKGTFANPYSVKEATEAFCWGFERPRESTAKIDDRIAYAWNVYYYNHVGD